jgi:glycosyltransferase involved in cell wall biosynthesis
VLNIGFVHSVAALGGAERMTEALVRELPRELYKSFLLCPESGAMPELFSTMNIESHYFDFIQPSLSSPFKTLKGRKLWIQAIEKLELDILHTADLVCTRTLLSAAKSKNVPVVCHIHFPFKKTFSDWVFKNLPKPSAFIFCSQELQNDVGEQLAASCPQAKQVVIHNGVDTNFFTPINKPPVKQKRIGIVANLQQRKGHEDFLKMAEIVSRAYHDVHFDIIGGDILQEPREPYLKKVTAELGLLEQVTFHGQVDNVRELIGNLDILVCASHQEAFPVSILEAMACGKTIVTTNVNGIPEAIENNQCGILVNPHKPAELAEAVLSLLKAPQEAAILAENARKKVVNNFSRAAYAQSIQSLYETLI